MLVEKEQGALRIAALDASAARLGITIGMTLTETRTLMPNLAAAEANRQADAEALRTCAELCAMFTPLVAIDRMDGLMLDITGCAHLFGGEAALLQRTRHKIARMGFTSSAAIAGTPDAARAFARFARNTISAPGQDEALAHTLPITALAQEHNTTVALSRAGFRTLGDLAKRPSSLLAARFGEGLVVTLQRILGREDIRITPLRALPECMAERHFPEPLVLMDSLLGALERLVQDIAGALERRGEGGRVFEASVFRTDGTVRRLEIETAQATRNTAALLRLVELKIEALADPLDPGFGFDAVRLAVTRSEPVHTHQQMLDGKAQDADSETAIAELIGRLVARFGREDVRRFVGRDTHDPVRSSGTTPSLSAIGSVLWPALEAGSPPARPLTLFEPPQLIEAIAEVPDGPPLLFRWRRILHEISGAEGPERIAPEWWREGSRAPATRDYYRVEDADGHRFWIFREGLYEDSNTRPRWFLHGLFA